MIKQAVILAGGQGTRLRPFTLKNPKPMFPIDGRPFLEYLIKLLKDNNIKEVVLLLGYLPEKITEYFKDGSKFGIKIKYSISPVEDESGARIKKAEHLLDDKFLLMYCDNYWPLQIEKLEKFYQEHKADVSVVAYSNKDNFTKSNMLIDNQGFIAKYDRERKDKNLNGVEIGFFIINKKILKLLPEHNSHFEKDILPELILQKQVSGYLTDHKYCGISNLERIEATEKFLSPKKVVFLDRDGVINKKMPQGAYVRNWSEFEFLPGAIKGAKLLNKKGYQIYLISNQAGVGKGLMKKQDLDLINRNMEQELNKNGVKIKGMYYCIHNWDDGCECRKPKPGMFFQAAREHYLDLTKSIFIGDDPRDKEAGEAAGCKTILVDKNKNLLSICEFL